jgi:hypothetical protein
MKDGATPVFIAAQQGHVEAIRALVEHGSAIESLTNNGTSPLKVANHMGQREASTFLVNMGADVKQCFQDLDQDLDPRFDHIREMVTQFGIIVGLPNNNINNNDDDNAKCAMFSLAKLMCCFFHDEKTGNADNEDDNNDDAHKLLEINIAIGIRHAVSSAVIEHMQETGYVLKRRLVRGVESVPVYSTAGR